MFRLLLGALALVAAGSCANIGTTAPFWGQKWADHSSPRGLAIDDAGDILVVCRSCSNIEALWEEETEQGNVVRKQEIIKGQNGLNLNHGIVYSNGYLYASSLVAVYRWPYTAGDRKLITVPEERVIFNIPDGGHDTRSLIFDIYSRLYVSVGSGSNVDKNSDRARIRRFSLTNVPIGGIDFNTGEVFADGLRNEVGLDFDPTGILWGVENGADMLNRPDIGGDVHNGNPAEDLNKFDGPVGSFYGYPYCFASYDLPGYEKGTQFAWPDFMNDGTHSDAWCRNPANNRPPALAMPAHNAPLGIAFYKGEGCGTVPGAFPCSAIGDAIVGYHGSWNSDNPVGHRVGWLPFNNNTNLPTGESIDIIFEQNNNNCNGNCFTPVNVVFNKQGHLILSCDSTHALYRVTYDTPPPKMAN